MMGEFTRLEGGGEKKLVVLEAVIARVCTTRHRYCKGASSIPVRPIDMPAVLKLLRGRADVFASSSGEWCLERVGNLSLFVVCVLFTTHDMETKKKRERDIFSHMIPSWCLPCIMYT